MKTQIDKTTIKKIMEQARALGAFTKPKDGHKSIQCEVEKPDGKRVFVTVPVRLIDWIKDFDTPPAMEITEENDK